MDFPVLNTNNIENDPMQQINSMDRQAEGSYETLARAGSQRTGVHGDSPDNQAARYYALNHSLPSSLSTSINRLPQYDNINQTIDQEEDDSMMQGQSYHRSNLH